jgi:hypothetical protein
MMKYSMKGWLSVILLSLSLNTFAQEEAYVYYNNLYNAGSAYEIADIKGQGTTWEWAGRSLRFSNSSGTPNSNQEYPECEDWIILGPFDLAVAQNTLLKFVLNVEYGSNALSVHVSEDFPGINPGEVQLSGTWTEVMASGDITATLETDTEIQVDLSTVNGKKNVYIGIKYATPTSAEVKTNIIKNFALTRSVHAGVEEMLPAVTFSRSFEGIDFYNFSATPLSTAKWSIRTGYAKATIDDDIWLVMKPFDLSNAADAFFSFESRLLNGTSGPVGLQIKVLRGEYDPSTSVGDYTWEDYPVTRVDHRINPLDYFNSEKLDLSSYCGNKITIAYRYANAAGEQYEVKNFKLFHLPDVEAPTINTLTIDKVVHNRIIFNLNSTEEAQVYYGVYNASANAPTFDELMTGTGAAVFGSGEYLSALTDTAYSISGLSSETDYKLYIGLMDGSNNRTLVSELPFSTPVADFDPPVFQVEFQAIENHSLSCLLTPSETCTFYYLFRESSLGSVTASELKQNGTVVVHSAGYQQFDFFELVKNTQYSLFILGTDLADNESAIEEFTVQTANIDLIAPFFNLLSLGNFSNTGFRLSLNLTEKSTIFYAVQKAGEVPPNQAGIQSGGRAIISGQLEYLVADQIQEYDLDGLNPYTDYVLYVYATDDLNNASSIHFRAFSTTQSEIPYISLKNEDRIYIDLETPYDITFDLFTISNIHSLEGYNLIIENGNNFSVAGQSILPEDDYNGRLFVPIYIDNGSMKSNKVQIEFVVAQDRMVNYFDDVREVMTGQKLNPMSDKDAAIALLEMQEDGSFFDKLSPLSPGYSDYMTKVLGGRLISIADGYYKEKYRRRKRIEVRHKLYKAIEFWIDNKPEWSLEGSVNYWPEDLGAIVLVLYKDMVLEYEEEEAMRETIDRLIGKVKAFNEWCWQVPEGESTFQPHQGTNLSARLWGSMAMAAFTNSVQDAFIIYDAIDADMAIKINDASAYPAGFKADGSFHMNNESGGQWNWYGFGTQWLYDVLEYSEFTRRTPWRLPSEKYHLLGDAMEHGAQWLNWMDFIPHNLTGKHATRSGRRRNKEQVLDLINKVRYESFVNNVSLENNTSLLDVYGELDQEFATKDTSKYFWNSNIFMHRNNVSEFSLNMPSVRTGTPEAGQDSVYGIVNHHMGDGTLLTYTSDMNYTGRIYWDYKRLPGTTIEQNKAALPLNIGGNNGKSLNLFAGGISNGINGVASFYYDRNGTANVNGYKSYFFFDQGVVALGTGIKKKNANKVYEVFTTAEQDVLSTDIKYLASGDVISNISVATIETERNIALSQPAWIHHNSTGYMVYPQQGGDELKIEVARQKGSWDEINGTWRWQVDNPNYEMRYDSIPVMHIAINHKKEPVSARYAYMVFPAKSENGFKNFVGNNPIQIVSNNDSVQVVWDESTKTAGLVFIEPDTARITSELSVVVDKPVTMLVKKKENGEFEAWVADPYQRESMVDIRFLIRKPNQMPVDIQRLVVMPNGVFKGQAAYTTTGDVWALIPPLPNEEEEVTEESQEGDELLTNQGDGNSLEVEVYPTVLMKTDAFTVRYQLEKAGTANIEVVNLAGQLMYAKSKYAGKGSNTMEIPCRAMDEGVFIVKVTIGDKVETQKIVIR